MNDSNPTSVKKRVIDRLSVPLTVRYSPEEQDAMFAMHSATRMSLSGIARQGTLELLAREGYIEERRVKEILSEDRRSRVSSRKGPPLP